MGGDAEGVEKVALQRVRVAMCAIQNFHIDWMVDTQATEGERMPNKVGRFLDHNWLLSPAEITNFAVKFSILYKNRMDKLLEEKSEAHFKKALAKGLLGEKSTFKPKINPKNKTLAEKQLIKKAPALKDLPQNERLVAQKRMSVDYINKLAAEKLR